MSAAVRAVEALVERMLRDAGPLPALGEEQRALASIVARALDAPPGAGALVTLAQAATGTGKTVALLAPVMALAALQKGTDQNVAIHLYTHERACPEARSARGRGVSNNARARQRPWISAVSARADSRAA